VAAIISMKEYEFYQRLKAQRDRRFEALDALSAPFKDVPPEEIEREVAKAIRW